MANAAVVVLLFSGVLNKPAPVSTEVYIGPHGPYRFLVDTGAQSSMMDTTLAAELRLTPQFRVELVTAQTTQIVPGAKLRTLRVDQSALPEAEVLFHEMSEPRRLNASIRGVLGLSALSGLNFMLTPAIGKLDFAGEPPVGETLKFWRLEDRIAVKARMGEEILTLILDSGASNVVLFRTPAAMAKTRPIASNFTTIDGARSVVPTTWTEDMIFSDHLRLGTLPAAIVRRNGSQVDGLLPVSVFKKVYVDQGRGEVVLVR